VTAFNLVFLLIQSVFAGSICNDGTYSQSEGRGTCSYHGGVATSGVYREERATVSYSNKTSVSQEFPQPKPQSAWEQDYGVTDSGHPTISTLYASETKTDFKAFHYFCSPLRDGTSEAIILAVQLQNVLDHKELAVAPKDSIKVFTFWNGKYQAISGNWSWKTFDGILMLAKGTLDLGFKSTSLSPQDMKNILFTEKLTIVVKGRGLIEFQIPEVKSNMIDTWKKCQALTPQDQPN
jgi:hypothetical protein